MERSFSQQVLGGARKALAAAHASIAGFHDTLLCVCGNLVSGCLVSDEALQTPVPRRLISASVRRFQREDSRAQKNSKRVCAKVPRHQKSSPRLYVLVVNFL